MPAVGVVERADIALGRDRRAQLRAIDQARAGIAVALRELGMPALHLRPLPLLDGGEHPAVDPVAVDPMALDALLQQCQSGERDIPGAARILGADQLLEIRLLNRGAGDRLAAAAARGAPTDALCFQQHDTIATL